MASMCDIDFKVSMNALFVALEIQGDGIKFEFQIPTVFLDRGKDEQHMIVYHALGSTLCMFVPVIRELTVEFYRQLVRDLSSMSKQLKFDP